MIDLDMTDENSEEGSGTFKYVDPKDILDLLMEDYFSTLENTEVVSLMKQAVKIVDDLFPEEAVVLASGCVKIGLGSKYSEFFMICENIRGCDYDSYKRLNMFLARHYSE